MFNEAEPFEAQKTWSQGISDNVAVEQSINNDAGTRPGGKQLVAEVYHLFSMMRSYPPFSNTRWTGSGKVEEYRSLEGVHNNVHVFIGGMTYGHMSENEVAAFDPAFWMHHGYANLFYLFTTSLTYFCAGTSNGCCQSSRR